MPYANDGFNTHGASKSGNAPSVHTYSTTDAIADVNTAGYFNAIASLLRVGDIIFCYTSTGGTPAMSIVWVNSNTGSVVDVTDGLTVTATDSD
jgi:hypothetical protein